MKLGHQVGRVLAQSVISWHLTSAARFRSVVDKLALGQNFLSLFLFFAVNSNPPMLHSSSSTCCCYRLDQWAKSENFHKAVFGNREESDRNNFKFSFYN